MKTSKHKKQKKHKKHKRERKASSSSSNSEVEWVESGTVTITKDDSSSKETLPENSAKNEPSQPEQDWLSHCLKSSASTSKSNQPKEIKESGPLGQHERELNPYWKDGGTGLPENESDKVKVNKTIIGDGGARWYKRAYQRIMERAAEENKDPEEIAQERWGSLSKLKSLIIDAESNQSESSSSSHSSRYKYRENYYYSSNSYDRREGRDRKKQSIFSKPKDNYEIDREHHDQRHTKFNKPKDDYRTDRGYNNERRGWKQTNFNKLKDDYEDDKNLIREHDNKHTKFNKPQFEDDTEAKYKEESKSPPSKSPPKDKTDDTYTSENIVSFPSSSNLPRILTDSEKNQLNAKIFKAELKGNTELVEKLTAELEASERAEKEVLLTQTNSSGFTFPVAQDRNSYPRKTKHKTHDNSGKRTSYLPDDSEYSLKQMFESEKMISAREQNSLFMSSANKMNCNDDEFDDIIMDRASRKVPKLSSGDRMSAIRDHQKLSNVRDRCKYCIETNSANKNLVVQHFQNVYLMLPPTMSLTDGHCFIIPSSHISASLLLDEDVQEEIKEVKRKLIDHFANLEKFPIFLETSTGKFHHTVIECVPVSRDIFHDAPMYFKKAIMESDTEWSDNKKLIDLYKKDLQHSVPKNMPYFAVQFSLGGGFAHVIEDHRLFTRHFGQEILGNLLDADPQAWLKPRFESGEMQKQKMSDFMKLWNN